MDGVRDEFRKLIKLEERREELLENYGHVFENVSLVTYPEAWETQELLEDDGAKSLDDMEPFCLTWPEFDRKFQGRYHLIVSENTEPPPAEDMEEGYRDLYGPIQDLDDYPDIPSVYCRRAQPLRLPRNFKQRLPFPLFNTPDLPSLHVKPWMLESSPPTIDWDKQHYKSIVRDGDIKPLYVRWDEYPEYDIDEAEKVHIQKREPTMKELAQAMMGKKTKKGMVRIYEEKKPKTKEELDDFLEEVQKKEQLTRLLLGHIPDHWWQKRENEVFTDFSNHEVVGKKMQTTSLEEWTPVPEHLAGNPFKEEETSKENPKFGFGFSKTWKGGRRMNRNQNDWKDNDGKDPEWNPGRSRDGFWRGQFGAKSGGGSAWNRGKYEPLQVAAPLDPSLVEQ